MFLADQDLSFRLFWTLSDVVGLLMKRAIILLVMMEHLYSHDICMHFASIVVTEIIYLVQVT